MKTTTLTFAALKLQAADPEHFDIFADDGHFRNSQVTLVDKELWCSQVALN
jgi:hypothetical protein